MPAKLEREHRPHPSPLYVCVRQTQHGHENIYEEIYSQCIQDFNDCLVVYIENDAVDRIDNETIIHQFKNMKTLQEE